MGESGGRKCGKQLRDISDAYASSSSSSNKSVKVKGEEGGCSEPHRNNSSKCSNDIAAVEGVRE
jgi:hypothetical protein